MFLKSIKVIKLFVQFLIEGFGNQTFYGCDQKTVQRPPFTTMTTNNRYENLPGNLSTLEFKNFETQLFHHSFNIILLIEEIHGCEILFQKSCLGTVFIFYSYLKYLAQKLTCSPQSGKPWDRATVGSNQRL